MKQSEIPREVLEKYVSEIAKENDLPQTPFCPAQWKVMGEKMDHFASLSKNEGASLLLFYVWYNYRDVDYENLPWTIPKIPKELFIEMRSTWSSLEQDVIEFTQLNQKIAEQQRKQEPEQER